MTELGFGDLGNKRIAYMMSRFPKITETFILFEMVEAESQGVEVEVYPLLREKTSVMHPDAISYVERAHFSPFISLDIFISAVYFLVRKPKVYAQTLWTLFVQNLGSVRYLGGAAAYFPKILHMARKMQQEGIEHIHAHFASHPAMAAYVIHQFTGIPYSFTAHGSDLFRDQHMLKQKVEQAAFVVAISNYNRKFILDICGDEYSDKVLVLHCGVNLETFADQHQSGSNGKDSDRFVILCIGTLHEVKGQKYLLEACEKLMEKGINFSCEFIGDGEDERMLKGMAFEKNMNESVVFHGRKTQQEIVEHLQRADVLVQPSVPTANGRREGIPMVLMEGMSSGVPVISSRLTGIPELVEDGGSGILTDPGDVDAIADALVLLYSNPALREQYGIAGRKKVETEFDLNKNASSLIQTIREVGKTI